MTNSTPRRSRRAVAPVTTPSGTTDPTAPVEPSAPVEQSVSVEKGHASAAGPAAPADEAGDRATTPGTTGETSTAVPASIVPPVAADPPASAESSPPGRRVGSLRLVLALALVAVLAFGAAGGFAFRVHQLRSTDSASNSALVDTALTNEVISSVSADLNRVFSYDSADPGATSKAASELLVGDASSQYKTLFDALQKKSEGQQLTLRTTTVLAGVSKLTPGSARLLVFLDQVSSRASDSSSQKAAAQLNVDAVKQGGTWKISVLSLL